MNYIESVMFESFAHIVGKARPEQNYTVVVAKLEATFNLYYFCNEFNLKVA